MENFNLKKCDKYEQFSINDMIKRGIDIDKAVEIYINNLEGDYSQLSEYLRKKKEIKK